jgi:CHASE2 domain-containing sensor protein
MKLFHIDNFFSTVFVFFFLLFLPIIFNFDFLDPIQNTIEDFYVTDFVFSRLVNNEDIDLDSNIVLVNISHLNRKGIARQIEIINKYKPLAIGVDAFFKDEKSPELDVPLIRSFANTKNLIMVSDLKETDNESEGFDTLHTSHAKFIQFAETGFANFVIREGDFRTVRKFSSKEEVGEIIELSFPVKISQLLYPEHTEKFLDRKNDLEIINFRRNIDKYITLDAMEVFDRKDELGFINGKVVLMGFLGPSLGDIVREDLFFTPLNKQFVGKSYPDMYGMVVHANIISMIGEEDYLISIPSWLNNLITFLLVYFLMVLFTYIRDRFPNWYEPVSVIVIFSVLLMVFWIVVGIFYILKLEIMIKEAFFAITISGMGYEGYQDSVKPISISFYKKIKNKIKRSKQ